MSVPLIPRNLERREETLMSAPFAKAEGRTPWVSMLETPVKRDFKKMDGKLRILKHN